MISYKNKLMLDGYTDEEIESKLLELDEVVPIEIDSWEELNGLVINGYRFGMIKHMLSVTKVVDGKERVCGTLNLELNPTFAIESWLMVLGVYVMLIKNRILCDDEIC